MANVFPLRTLAKGVCRNGYDTADDVWGIAVDDDSTHVYGSPPDPQAVGSYGKIVAAEVYDFGGCGTSYMVRETQRAASLRRVRIS